MRTLATLIFCLSLQYLGGEVLLRPPLGRQWGEAPSGLLEWAGKVGLDVIVELPADEPDLQIFTFQESGGGIPGEKWKTAKAIEARFFQDRLFELTIHFEFPGMAPDKVRQSFHRVKQEREKKLGQFRLNGRSQSVDDQFLTREEAFHYEPAPNVFLMMAYTSVEDQLRKTGEGRYSVVYHNGRVGPASRKEQPTP